MQKFWKYNYVMFVAVFMAVILCIPFLSIKTAAKKAKTVSTAVTKTSSVSSYKEDSTDKKLKSAGLVNLKETGADFIYDQRYGTTNNFTGTKIYKSEKVYLASGTAKKLVEANKDLKKYGYKIKIWDAYRPLSVQYFLYSKAPSGCKAFIASPYKECKSVHNHGAAVDITLVKLDGSSVEMPTDFDNMTYASYYESNCKSASVAERRKLLHDVMTRHGFEGIEIEWWHFNDTEAYKYPVVDIAF